MVELVSQPQDYQTGDIVLARRGDVPVNLVATTLPGGSGGGSGEPGPPGPPGLSAYEVWLEQGNTGSEADFLASLQGAPGTPGNHGQPGNDGTPGQDGDSAYEIWLSIGNVGDEADFIASLKGEPGEKGDKGDKGDPGDGSGGGEVGPPGPPGASAYEVWLQEGNTGSEEDFLASLKGEPGAPGTNATITAFTDEAAFEAYTPATNELAVLYG